MILFYELSDSICCNQQLTASWLRCSHLRLTVVLASGCNTSVISVGLGHRSWFKEPLGHSQVSQSGPISLKSRPTMELLVEVEMFWTEVSGALPAVIAAREIAGASMGVAGLVGGVADGVVEGAADPLTDTAGLK